MALYIFRQMQFLLPTKNDEKSIRNIIPPIIQSYKSGYDLVFVSFMSCI